MVLYSLVHSRLGLFNSFLVPILQNLTLIMSLMPSIINPNRNIRNSLNGLFETLQSKLSGFKHTSVPRGPGTPCKFRSLIHTPNRCCHIMQCFSHCCSICGTKFPALHHSPSQVLAKQLSISWRLHPGIHVHDLVHSHMYVFRRIPFEPLVTHHIRPRQHTVQFTIVLQQFSI